MAAYLSVVHFLTRSPLAANIMVRYLGEEGEKSPISAAISMCNPFNLVSQLCAPCEVLSCAYYPQMSMSCGPPPVQSGHRVRRLARASSSRC